jgi:hypothetical protein
MSVWTRAIVAATKAVSVPTTATVAIAVSDSTKSGASRATT